MHTASLEDSVPVVLLRGRSMLEEYWNKTAKRYLEDMIDMSLTSTVPMDALKTAGTSRVPETVEV